MARPVSPEALADLLASQCAKRRVPLVVASDGDGTLWRGDVGEDLFSWAIEKRLLRRDALPRLLTEAAAHGIAIGPGVADVKVGLRAGFWAVEDSTTQKSLKLFGSTPATYKVPSCPIASVPQIGVLGTAMGVSHDCATSTERENALLPQQPAKMLHEPYRCPSP